MGIFTFFLTFHIPGQPNLTKMINEWKCGPRAKSNPTLQLISPDYVTRYSSVVVVCVTPGLSENS